MKPTVLLLDDEPDNLTLLQSVLRGAGVGDDIDTVGFTAPAAALEWCRTHEPDLCLIDYNMPGMDGLTFLTAARLIPGFHSVPIVLVTGAADKGLRQRALLAGATDFLTRPVDAAELRARAHNLLALRLSRADPRRTIERLARDVELVTRESVERDHESIILKLSQLSCCRDEETGNHMRRVAHIAQLLARGLGADAPFADMIYLAAPMHDIGKVGIPDRILLKPGQLTPEEWEVMKTHTTIGHDVLKGSSSPLLRMGAEIAYSHHERYDGTGYPRGLAGENIPVVGRIVAVADELDALLSVRPYKRAWSYDEALKRMRREQGGHFDPACIDVMFRHIEALLEIEQRFRDEAPVATTVRGPSPGARRGEQPGQPETNGLLRDRRTGP